jgi:cobalt transporter subunit CbtB
MRASLSAATIDTSAQRRSVAAPAALAALLGVFLLWGVGFSHIGAFHNAAHDTRHSNAFPCH